MSARTVKRTLVSISFAAALLVAGLLPTTTPATTAVPAAPSLNWLRTPANFAHALGGLTVSTSSGDQIYTYTNTLEAFKQNYAKGYRIFEVDMIPTRDGYLACRHDWSADLFRELGEPVATEVPSRSEFLATKVFGKYTPLDAAALMDLMRSHPDMYIVTDTKYSDAPHVRAEFKQLVAVMGADKDSLSKRVIVQIYDEPMLGYVRGVYPFKNIIYTLYRQGLSATISARAIQFAKANGINVITMDMLRYTPALVAKARAVGVAVAVNTINSSTQASSLNAVGVRYLYSDALRGRPGSGTTFVATPQSRIASDAVPFNPHDD